MVPGLHFENVYWEPWIISSFLPTIKVTHGILMNITWNCKVLSHGVSLSTQFTLRYLCDKDHFNVFTCSWIPPLCSLVQYNHQGARFNSLTPVRSECDSKNVIFNLVLLIGIFRSSHDNALWWMPQDLDDDKSTLVQVMAWCCQATSHYLTQC